MDSTKPLGEPDHQKLALIGEVMWAVPGLYHRMSAVLEQVYGAFDLTAGKRSLLRDLSRLGPHTIAQMVRARPPVTRQYIHRLVSELRQAGLVHLRQNPDDGRSKVVHLAPEGERVVTLLAPSERRIGSALVAGLSTQELETTCNTLNKINAHLENRALWSNNQKS